MTSPRFEPNDLVKLQECVAHKRSVERLGTKVFMVIQHGTEQNENLCLLRTIGGPNDGKTKMIHYSLLTHIE
jgi:hypothetical protein